MWLRPRYWRCSRQLPACVAREQKEQQTSAQPRQHPRPAKNSCPLATAFVPRCPSPSLSHCLLWVAAFSLAVHRDSRSFYSDSQAFWRLLAFLQRFSGTLDARGQGCAEAGPHTMVCFRTHASPRDSRFPQGRAFTGFSLESSLQFLVGGVAALENSLDCWVVITLLSLSVATCGSQNTQGRVTRGSGRKTIPPRSLEITPFS